jgi:membrane fusion protein, multidrug efflux system
MIPMFLSADQRVRPTPLPSIVPTGRVGLLLGSLLLLSSCSGNRASANLGGPAKESVPVTVATVTQKTVPVEVNAIGTVEPYSSVSVKALVSGELKEVHFKEGQEVRRGDLLFKIDPRPFEAELRRAEGNLAKDTAQAKQAEANLARDMAQAKNAEVQSRRYADLFKEGVVAREVFDQFRTNSDALDATIQADKASLEYSSAAIRSDKAAIENAKLQLGYCTIRSPMDGRTGNLIVYQGNIVKANDNPPLVIINQIQPVYVTFSVPEQYLSEIKKQTAAGRLAVAATVPKEETTPVQGVLTFIDNTVDSTTGTIRLKGTLANQEKRLWPGQFVNVALTLSTHPNAVVVPSRAVQTGQTGQYVFLVKADRTVESRPVVIGASLKDEIIVEQGLKPGEIVVTDGQLRLVPGTFVEVKQGSASSQEKGL